MNKNKLISIITVVRNREAVIEKCILTVLKQKCKNFQFIIIDGDSSDKTLSVINNYRQFIDVIISEKDSGIYDAMNKGIKYATGDFIFFLNSDDQFIDDEVTLRLSKLLDEDFDVFYGGIIKIYIKGKEKYIQPLFSINNLKRGIMPPHQGLFVKKDVFRKVKFSTEFKSSSDFDFCCKLIINKFKICRINTLVSIFYDGGISSNKILAYSETENIIEKYFGKYNATIFYLRRILFEQGIKRILVKLNIL